MKQKIIVASLMMVFFFTSNVNAFVKNSPKVIDEVFVDSVWAANRVFYDLKTLGNTQYIAYYDTHRNMCVAKRELGSKKWSKKILPNVLTWDSHNYVTLGIDKKGYIHVSGNMHAIPLIYFRSVKPYDISEFVQVKDMVARDEERVTYPNFFNNKNNDLFYLYRNGGSGDGDIFVNSYDTNTKKWSRFFDYPLFVGIDKVKNITRSAYHKLDLDNEGNFYLTWMWRWTPMVETCHQLCYVTTKDMKNWYNGKGVKINMPLRPDMKEIIVDDVPSKGGLHNGKFRLFLTKDKKPIIGYLKNDKNGNIQFFITRVINNKWVSKQLSNWNFKWKFIGGGDEMTLGATFDMVGLTNKGNLAIEWSNDMKQKGVWFVDLKTLNLVNDDSQSYTTTLPEGFLKSVNPALNVQVKEDDAQTLEDGSRYILRWEAGAPSHKKHEPKVIPTRPLSALKLYHIK